MSNRGSRKFRAAFVEQLEPRVMLATAALIDYQVAPPLAYANPTPLVVGDQVVFADAGNESNNWQSAEVYNVDTGQWSTQQFDHRLGDAGVAVGDQAIFAGGNSVTISTAEGASGSTVADIYDADTGQWSSGQLSSARIEITAVAVGDKALFAGGVPADSEAFYPPLSAVDIYDSTTGQWSTASLSLARNELAATSVDGLALFAGGMHSGPQGEFSASNVVDIYNGATNQWSTTTMPEAMTDAEAGSAGNFALFADNGNNAQLELGAETNVDIYDAANGIWSTAALSQRRYNIAVASVDGQLLFAGGYYMRRGGYINYPSEYVDIFHADTDSWSISRLPEAMQFSSSATLGNETFFVGSSPAGVNVAEIYDAITGQWSMTTLASNAYAPAAVAVDGKFIVANASDQYDQSANPLEVLSSTDDVPPEPELPGAGRIFGAPPSVFKWSATAGATSYDVYVDGSLAATVNDNRWTASLGAVGHGSHSWYVVAHVGAGTLGSGLTGYYVEGAQVRILLGRLRLQKVDAVGSHYTLTVVLTGGNLAAAPKTIQSKLFASDELYALNDPITLGGTQVILNKKDLSQAIPVQVLFTLPSTMTLYEDYCLVVGVEIHRTIHYISPPMDPFQVIAAPKRRGIYTTGVWQN